MGLTPKESFRYQHLDDKTRTIVWERTSEIKNLMRLTAENIINIGQKLTDVKQQLEHGTFQSWLRTEFEWSEQTARQFMQVYRWSETLQNKNFVFSQLATSALYLLAAPSTPPEARKEVLGLVKVGEKVTYTRTKTIVDRHKNLISFEKADQIVDITAKSEISEIDRVNLSSNISLEAHSHKTLVKPASVTQRLFRLETKNIGCIVRLYRTDELETHTELRVGELVTIKVGRWCDQTATIIEELTDIQLSEIKAQATPILPELKKKDMSVYTVKQKETSTAIQPLTISYGKINLAIAGNVEKLKAFIKQIQTNGDFVEEIFEQALNEQTNKI